jgi:hypothetical protein
MKKILKISFLLTTCIVLALGLGYLYTKIEIRSDKVKIEEKLTFLFKQGDYLTKYEYFTPYGQLERDYEDKFIYRHDGGWNYTVLEKQISGYKKTTYSTINSPIIMQDLDYYFNPDIFLEGCLNDVKNAYFNGAGEDKVNIALFESLVTDYHSIENVRPVERTDFRFLGSHWKSTLTCGSKDGTQIDVNVEGRHFEIVENDFKTRPRLRMNVLYIFLSIAGLFSFISLGRIAFK